MNVREELEKLKGKTVQETMVRVAPEAHKMLIELAAKHGVSMRQLVTLGVKLLYEQDKASEGDKP